MEHYQITKPCGVCQEKIIADVFSIGTGHQTIEALTHYECAVRAGGTIMKEGEVKDLSTKQTLDI